ncbi:hypothetical protein STSP2_01894 [Anaerohalosphaera lusitana]|uniref:JAB domain-containing protein n=1 Tax=Anaerohalosphaera lusitana TaxID=1936003 RepID=A0A1U9NLA4_9BACT|nr:Mov34/MPN/PAD-1 family protein [Anaerohalosphaera lusitana]AQT68722.1 hypothetical protein STSP2_01894 [Anaerohalosphaera lusitana]
MAKKNKTTARTRSQSKTVKSNQKKKRSKNFNPILRFSPTAWAKLLYFRDKSDNEVAGFAVTDTDDLLYVREFVTITQQVTSVTVSFHDEAVADYFDRQVDAGKRPEQFARVWLHTHPSDSPTPSATDNETFARVFGSCQWAVMFILAEDDNTFAKLRFNVGPGADMLIPVRVDYGCQFGPTDHDSWDAEYEQNVIEIPWASTSADALNLAGSEHDEFWDDLVVSNDMIDQLEALDPATRRSVMDELAQRPDLWDDESEVFI